MADERAGAGDVRVNTLVGEVTLKVPPDPYACPLCGKPRAHGYAVRPAKFFHELVSVGLVAESVGQLNHRHTHTPIIRRGYDSERAGQAGFLTNMVGVFR